MNREECSVLLDEIILEHIATLGTGPNDSVMSSAGRAALGRMNRDEICQVLDILSEDKIKFKPTLACINKELDECLETALPPGCLIVKQTPACDFLDDVAGALSRTMNAPVIAFDEERGTKTYGWSEESLYELVKDVPPNVVAAGAILDQSVTPYLESELYQEFVESENPRRLYQEGECPIADAIKDRDVDGLIRAVKQYNFKYQLTEQERDSIGEQAERDFADLLSMKKAGEMADRAFDEAQTFCGHRYRNIEVSREAMSR